ncbi:MAG: DUF3054 domain-containing protein [Acidimicrobiaceae bacterium]|nr:DUF3054 domain-containing protein [Acidimicrobiaceae bacterium]MBP9053943.1 DUF3054 domain-containing protein [Ilumatobacteraceae bacterium]
MTEPGAARRLAIAAGIDIASVVAFVVIGRKNHDESGSLVTGTLKVVAPFLIALALGWVVARAWRAPMAVNTGIVVWLVTLVAGMLLRKFVFDGGTALPFIIVASLFTLLSLVGWRFLAEWRAPKPAAGT